MTIPEPFLRDLAGELEAVMKADDPDELRKAQLPLLQISADHVAPNVEPIEKALDVLIGRAVEGIESPTDRGALKELFLGGNRWQPLARRGAAAATELSVTYDALRRRNKAGRRRLDDLLVALAHSINEIAPLDDLALDRAITRVTAPDPGENVRDRASVFLSYSRHDDEHEGGLISELREQLITEFRFQTGQDLFVFHDKSSIDLGENWRRKIEAGIDTTSFLLVLLTPSYLKSPTCRDELQRFLERERELERDDLVLPIYYATIPNSSGDDLAEALLARQHVDWRALRFQSFDDVPVRRAVAELASAVATAISRTADRPSGHPTGEKVPEELGLVERLAEMELANSRFVRSLFTMSTEQEGVTEEVQQATREMTRLNESGRGGAARLLVTKRLVSKLEPYADRLEENAEAIRADLDTIEAGISAMAEQLPSSTEEGIEETTEGVIESLRGAHAAGEQASESVEAMGMSYADTARNSSTMRPVLNRMLRSVKVVTECPPRFARWIYLLEEALRSRGAG